MGRPREVSEHPAATKNRKSNVSPETRVNSNVKFVHSTPLRQRARATEASKRKFMETPHVSPIMKKARQKPQDENTYAHLLQGESYHPSPPEERCRNSLAEESNENCAPEQSDQPSSMEDERLSDSQARDETTTNQETKTKRRAARRRSQPSSLQPNTPSQPQARQAGNQSHQATNTKRRESDKHTVYKEYTIPGHSTAKWKLLSAPTAMYAHQLMHTCKSTILSRCTVDNQAIVEQTLSILQARILCELERVRAPVREPVMGSYANMNKAMKSWNLILEEKAAQLTDVNKEIEHVEGVLEELERKKNRAKFT